eukprot:SAG11_NODE_427_length_9558_cov_4.909398_5_plen_81_part_00
MCACMMCAVTDDALCSKLSINRRADVLARVSGGRQDVWACTCISFSHACAARPMSEATLRYLSGNYSSFAHVARSLPAAV